MTKIILHKQIYKRLHLGGDINTTLCGRSGNYMPDGYGNVALEDSEVNCKLCLKKMRATADNTRLKKERVLDKK